MSRFGLSTVVLILMLGAGGVLLISSLSDGDIDAADATTSSTTSSLIGIASATTVTTSVPSGEETSTPSSTTTSSTTPSASTTTLASSTTSAAAATTTTGAPATTIPDFSASVTTPTAAQLSASWEPGCPVGPADLRLVTTSHWNYAGTVSTGRIVVAASLATQVVAIFEDLYQAGFPIERMELVDAYGGDDDASMAANNTSAFNCRLVTGGSTYSEHSYGRAIDINPLVNPYVKGSLVLPPAGAAYANRSLDAPGMIHPGDAVVTAFADRGWIWGGTWTSLKDYQHFSTTGN